MTPKEQATFKLLSAVQKDPDVSQRELARLLGVSNGKVHYLMAALVEKGLLKIDSFSRHGNKAAKIGYLLTPEGIRSRTALTKAYLARKEAEYEALWAEIKALRQEEFAAPVDAGNASISDDSARPASATGAQR